jgi:hypothetical protein
VFGNAPLKASTPGISDLQAVSVLAFKLLGVALPALKALKWHF